MASDANSPPLRLPERSLLADDVYDIIRESLIGGVIAPGSRLNLDSLARNLHVSNTPVRQALARLESEGLVTREAYRGFAASQLLDSRTIAELYEYRLILEPPTAALAARLSSGVKADVLDQLCDRGRVDALFDAGDFAAIALRDSDFHCSIADLSENRVIGENMRSTQVKMSLYSGYRDPAAWTSTWEEHRAIAAAIRDADPERAADAMRSHLTIAHARMSLQSRRAAKA